MQSNGCIYTNLVASSVGGLCCVVAVVVVVSDRERLLGRCEMGSSSKVQLSRLYSLQSTQTAWPGSLIHRRLRFRQFPQGLGRLVGPLPLPLAVLFTMMVTVLS
jgi:hypothetical protein